MKLDLELLAAQLHEGAMIDAEQAALRSEDRTSSINFFDQMDIDACTDTMLVDDPHAIVSIGKGTWCLHRDNDGKWFRQDARSGGWRLTDLTDTDMQELQEKIKP